MNRKAIISLICLIGFASFAWAQGSDDSRVIAYYFHGDFRCVNCYNIEQYTKEALENNFKEELGSGELVFEIVNTDKKENQHFAEDYQLYTKSVVLSLIKDGKEIEYKNLTGVWEYLRDKEGFYNYIKEETEGFLDKLDGDDL